ncbi:amidase [Aerococcaceae bacterium DSM 111176]|nr:amidase [Aerococcaceae bacterium DSM 111176]
MLFEFDATHYAQEIQSGETTVTELVERAITNIETLNPTLNAVVVKSFDEARDKSAQYDDYLKTLDAKTKSELPPFFGVPILLKDLGQSQNGVPTMSGAKLMEGHVANQTDNFTQRIEAAGFIVVGRTNVPEFGFKNISDSKFTGSVNSPIDATRNPGGASGGAAAALKAGMVPIVTASDGGGSIRIPASFSGLIGLKTSRGRIPVGPGGYRGWQGASVNFALTKSVRDTWTLLRWMQEEQFEAPFMIPRIVHESLMPLNRPLRIAYTMKSPIGSAVSPEAQAMMQDTIEKLETLGHSVVEAEPEIDGVKAMETYYKVNGVETASMMQDFEKALERAVTKEDMELMSWAIYQLGLNISGVEYSQVLAYWDEITAVAEAFHEEYDVLLMPATNAPAPSHDQFTHSDQLLDQLENIEQFASAKQQEIVWNMFEDSLAWTPFTQQMNLTGQPAISLPMYELDNGLPLGAQFSTRKGGEYLLLQLAKQLEDAGYLRSGIV